MIALGLGVIMVALTGAADPYQQTRQFREAVVCDQDAGGCLGDEPVSVVRRRTYTTTTTTTNTDANGHTYTSTSTTTHHEITWRRANGSQQARDVSSNVYNKAKEGQPATLRLWRQEVVGLEVQGETEWFLPEASTALGVWLGVAFFGLGLLLWGLLFGWWDGFFFLVYRTFCWMFMGLVPVATAAHTLAFGWATGGDLVILIVVCALFVGIPGWMLFGSIHERW
ncbi:hypothetical protein [Nonomuraea solani]|uniref:hypothetical protein n=1 Tax=Nonomuraea solani TaxID=1144553 RepID=UPI000CDEB8D9|nr:hypothetical protein [Nonomuraea solani]